MAEKSKKISARWVAALGLTLLLASCAMPDLDGKGQPGPMKPFVFSPYFDIHVALQSEPVNPEPPSAWTRTKTLLGVPANVFPEQLKALTLAFATGECGREHWAGLGAQQMLESHVAGLRRAGISYVISTGGAQGVFTCASEQGMQEFISRYSSRYLLGFDFDIEAGQSEAVIASLIHQIGIAMQRHPNLRFSFTLATVASTEADRASLNPQGELVMKAIQRAGLSNYFVNLMVMNFGSATPDNCVVESARCDMAASAMQSVQNFSHRYGVPLARIEVTPMIGINDVTDNVFTLTDANLLTRFVQNQGLGGLHFWSINRDGPCLAELAAVSAICHGLPGAARLAFTNTIDLALR